MSLYVFSWYQNKLAYSSIQNEYRRKIKNKEWWCGEMDA